MPLIVDGHNLIGQMPELSLADVDDEQRLIEILCEFCRRAGHTAEVYFDNALPGAPRARKHGRLTAYYTRTGKSADQAIFERLSRLGREAHNWTVISSDRQVQTVARAHHARVLSSSEFARQLRATLRQEERSTTEWREAPEITADEIKEWLRLFRENRPE
ncbi:MAG: NYN domain-containing protein [Anaerolineales bacterium]|nr:NYN domain-containing protein [Anaerolineales bacterium]MCS7248068.1 NYN domain-containing protein [Anaerolineales bacterium]MDW8161880.1 NYN domain-containing protein [Anaerolineales bacterium]MDW8447257.1 NYN domain-containing protein [Anaerolineales bacterium]